MSQFHSLTVADVQKETADAVSIVFEIPDSLAETFRFEPGQYLTLRTDIDGESVRRPYSICAAAGDDRLRVGVKAVAGGRFSTFAQGLKAGDKLDVMPPQGHFRWLSPADRPIDGGPQHHLAFAAGSGITPILSIVKSVLRHRPYDTVTLCYGNRGHGSVMFLDELHDLKDQALHRFRIMHVFSREQTDVELQHGHIDRDLIEALARCGYIVPTNIDVVYACGPGEMNQAVRDALESLGVAKEKVRFERFTSATPKGPPPAAVAAEGTSDAVDGHAIVDGVKRSFNIHPQEDVIAAAQRQGIELPYSCAGGMCCTCRCKVVEGAVKMDVCYSLEAWELEAGFVLACQAHPTTKKVVLDFDAR